MKKTIKSIQTYNNSRRNFLKASSGAVLALPILESFISPAAYGQSSSKRFVAFFAPCGVVHRDFWPANFGSGTNWQLSPILKPLENVKEHVTVYKGLHMEVVTQAFGTHARGPGAYLTCAHVDRNNVRNAQSIDQVIAKNISGQTPIESLQLGIEETTHHCDGYPCVYSTSISWESESRSLGRVVNPKTVFDQVVGQSSNTGGAEIDERDFAIKKSILDSLYDDFSRLENRVTYLDRIKLQEYAEGIRQVENKLNRENRGSCDSPITLSENYSRTEHSEIMLDLLHLAFSCDQTRVASFMLDNARSEYRYSFLGVSDQHHSLSHHGNSNNKLNQLTTINTWWYEQAAYFAEKLASTPDPINAGSLLDNTIIYFSNSMSDGDAHNFDNMPVITIGGRVAGLNTDRYVDLRQNGNERPTANFFLTLARETYGANINSFGDSNGTINGLYV